MQSCFLSCTPAVRGMVPVGVRDRVDPHRFFACFPHSFLHLTRHPMEQQSVGPVVFFSQKKCVGGKGRKWRIIQPNHPPLGIASRPPPRASVCRPTLPSGCIVRAPRQRTQSRGRTDARCSAEGDPRSPRPRADIPPGNPRSRLPLPSHIPAEASSRFKRTPSPFSPPPATSPYRRSTGVRSGSTTPRCTGTPASRRSTPASATPSPPPTPSVCPPPPVPPRLPPASHCPQSLLRPQGAALGEFSISVILANNFKKTQQSFPLPFFLGLKPYSRADTHSLSLESHPPLDGPHPPLLSTDDVMAGIGPFAIPAAAKGVRQAGLDGKVETTFGQRGY